MTRQPAVLEIAIKHPQKADVSVGMCPPTLRHALKSWFENSNNLSNALTNLSQKALVFFRKALKEVGWSLN